tara:strand:+ start:571 stop:1290 length:720 start_codon:yes stop_codon:yes gene_type:complete
MNKTEIKKEPKKRGRKPKGGKLISNINIDSSKDVSYKPNIILHLRCKSNNNDLVVTEGFNNDSVTYDNVEDDPIINNKDIWNKLRILNKELHTNNIRPSKTCFWDTCEFLTQPCFIPIDDNEHTKVYGTFCCPECAVAYLFNENIDTSTKWERYALINKLYKYIYNYDTNIKSAPDPRYLLNKYFGNLTINEYRNLNTNKHKQHIIINKPMTVITPEICETNNEISNFKSFNQKKTIFS